MGVWLGWVVSAPLYPLLRHPCFVTEVEPTTKAPTFPNLASIFTFGGSSSYSTISLLGLGVATHWGW